MAPDVVDAGAVACAGGEPVRVRVTVHGLVQGVGFRPFVYSLAHDLALSGHVANRADGVLIEVEGIPERVAEFVRRLQADAPVLAVIANVHTLGIPTQGGTDFVIAASEPGAGRTLVSPDVATCADCLAEMQDPADRRYRHPFISCTNCGPRFTVIVSVPYDRPGTTMAPLPLCAACAAQYADPADRRFHAQTVACPQCGPTLRLHQPGAVDLTGDDAMAQARRLLATGAVVAVKGLGGYHLACDATDETAVATLRKRKDRGDKPFAVMVGDIQMAERIALVSDSERALLQDPRRPVVLLRKRADAPASLLPPLAPSLAPSVALLLAPSVAPDHPDLGVMLAYTPVHHLLFGLPGDRPGAPVLVMTSGNVRGEPIVTDDEQARVRLAGLADAWLGHDRAIHVPCDDSVVRVTSVGQLPVRRSRGYAPMPVALPVTVVPALAVGADLKNTFCLGSEGYAWLSGHVGDMGDLATLEAFETATSQLAAITGVKAELIVADAHPAYRSAAWARRQPVPVRSVQHHHAHIASAMAENGHDGTERVIGFAFDGTGYGDDGAVWGGEVLLADYDGYQRAAHLRYVPLPGGDAGVRNPCRMALAHLHSAGVDWDPRLPCVAACTPAERRILTRQFETGLQCGPTSSMGRLFDAMSSLAGVCHRVDYEAEAAMRFEELARDAMDGAGGSGGGSAYAFTLHDPVGGGPVQADAGAVVADAARDVLAGEDPGTIAARFHLSVVDLVTRLATALRARTGLSTVALSGGVFLNVLLSTLCEERLREKGFGVLSHKLVPPSDAGICLGQLVIGARRPPTSGVITDDPRRTR